jgi:hypothetical protein
VHSWSEPWVCPCANIVSPSSQLQATAQEIKRIQENLPQVERRLFTFEVNETIEPSKFIGGIIE